MISCVYLIDFNGVNNLVAYANATNPEQLQLAWSRDSASFYTIVYELLNRGQCEPITLPKRVLETDVLSSDTTYFILRGLEPSSLYRVYVQSHYGVHGIMATESFITASTSTPRSKSEILYLGQILMRRY